MVGNGFSFGTCMQASGSIFCANNQAGPNSCALYSLTLLYNSYLESLEYVALVFKNEGI